ncbi:MAG TPA: FliM/FliN family flagellar motor switch protein [Solirubrobacteraceae bacterium]|nr:FliM/FliN family flagellar motor switch protein [Solirubrobacteraceae bacterium]
MSATEQQEQVEPSASAAVAEPSAAETPAAETPPAATSAAETPSAETPAGAAPAVKPAGTEPFTARRREATIRTVDFSQPTKFTAELRRRIARTLGPFCEAFALRLSTELRAPAELAIADSSQLTWSAAKAQLSANAIAVALQVAPIERQMLLCVEPPLILQALECLLGGCAAQAPADRRLSEVDWALTRRLLQSLIAQLNMAWRDLGGVELSLGEVDLEGDAGVIAPMGEPTFALTFESHIDAIPSSMCLLIPWSAIEPVAEEIAGGGGAAQEADPHAGRAVSRSLAAAHVRMRAEVGALRMPVQRMLALTPGSVLALDERAEHGVRLYAEGVPLGHARPGLRGARRAVKLTEAIAPGAAVVQSLPTADGAPATLAPVTLASADAATDPPSGPPADGEPAAPTRESLARMLGVPVRVWVELGRTTMALGEALALPPGSVVELDQGAEDPIELYVNGMRFAHGTLQVGAGGEWAVLIDALV